MMHFRELLSISEGEPDLTALTHTVYCGVVEWQSWARTYEQVPGK